MENQSFLAKKIPEKHRWKKERKRKIVTELNLNCHFTKILKTKHGRHEFSSNPNLSYALLFNINYSRFCNNFSCLPSSHFG